MGKWKSIAKRSLVSLAAVVLVVSWLGAAPSYAAQKSEVPKVVEQMTPSVVAIIGKPSSDTNKAWEKSRYNLAHGTGVIVESNGVIVTNAHVVKNMKNIVVVSSNGTTYNGRATNIDEESDLALVKIDATGLPVAKFADSSSDIEVGETVAAIGTPISFALRNSVTVGIVSGIDRSVNSQYQLIQTDAAINPGNSGGALINMNGEVIGINTMKYAEIGVENLGFAIPIDTVKYVLNHFKLYGKVKRPYLGVELEESWEAVVGLPSSTGLRVAYVDPDSPAAKAGIKQDDLVESIGSSQVKTMVDYNEALKKYLPGDTVSIAVKSGNSSVTKSITLGEAQTEESHATQDTDGSYLDADRGKTKIGDSHFGWSMKYPAGLVKSEQSDNGDSVSFVDAKGEFYLSVDVESNLSDELSPSALLSKLDGSGDKNYDGATILERQYVKQDNVSYAKIVGRSGEEGYVQTRGYLHQGKLYTVRLYVRKAQYNNSFKQNSFNDLLDSFQLSFNGKDESLKDISVYSDANTSHSNGYGLSFDLPSGWEKSSYLSGSSFYNADYSQVVAVSVTSASSGDTLKAWVDRERKHFESQFVADYRKMEQPVELTLAGVPALKVAYSQTFGSKWTSAYSLYFIKDKYKYEIDFTYPEDEDEGEVNKTLEAITASAKVDKGLMDKELGFIQDVNELLDPDRTVAYKNDKYKYTLQIPETWTNGKSYDKKEDDRQKFVFTGGSLSIQADSKTSYEDSLKAEDALQKKNHDNDGEYKYADEEVTLPGGAKAKKYVVHYALNKMPYQETIYIFRQNNVTFTAILHIREAVRTAENEARLNKAFDSIKFSDK